MNTNDIPKFGNLEGVRVLVNGTNVATPFSASLLAENGATVIQLESSMMGDTGRVYEPPYMFTQERRNVLGMNLNIVSPEGKEVLFKLIKNIDILFEGNKGGTYEKMGLSDEILWQYNPKLVIVHVSGFGQSGLPEYVTRPCFDSIGQAFGGYIWHNGEPDRPAHKAGMFAGDYITALFGCWSSLVAYIGAQNTGKGESIDLAMYEALWKIQAHTAIGYLRDGLIETRSGNSFPGSTFSGTHMCNDGEYIAVAALGASIMSNVLKFFGLEDDPMYPKFYPLALEGTPEGERLNALAIEYCSEHTSKEVEKEFTKAGIPCSRIYNIQTIQEDPHVQARELFVDWEDPHFGKVKGVSMVPKMKNRPGKIWRGAPLYGMDVEDILKELNYSQEQIEDLYEKKVIARTPKNGGYRK